MYEQLDGRFIAKSIIRITVGSKKYIKQNTNKGFSGILICVATGISPFTDTWCFAAGSTCKIAKTGTDNVCDLSYNESENYFIVTIQQVNTLLCSITSQPVTISDTI